MSEWVQHSLGQASIKLDRRYLHEFMLPVSYVMIPFNFHRSELSNSLLLLQQREH
jgi:hypothetical protein